MCPLGTIHPLTLVSHDAKESITQMIEFSMIRFPVEQNILPRHPTLFQLEAIPSTIHGTIKFKTCTSSTKIIASNLRPHIYYQIIAAPDLVRALKKSTEDCCTENHVIHPNYPEQVIRVGANLSVKTKTRLIALLKQFFNVFSR